ncbi:MAG: polyribonucleotide nucleotidyltransferase [Deltaproteobacteria bacterium]|jgi:polyribonucleotide nucleotidyltransferase|nr:polyribonucleotide nucleotidyltransferase [Deltaproteobacteria bacterium]
MSIFNPIRVTATAGGKEFIFETGRLANQADGAVWLQCGGTVVLVTVCSAPLPVEKDFFPLTVEYSEKMYAAGRIPGNFFRREIGRPSERETLCSRLIDRPIRPLFTDGFVDEVQVLANVISSDQENESDAMSITGASAALCISSLPFEGPVAGARVGRLDGRFVLNPTIQEQENSDINFIIAASRDAVVMVEGEAKMVGEDVVAEALTWAQKEMQPLIRAQEELAAKIGKAKIQVAAQPDFSELEKFISDLATDDIKAAMSVPAKMERRAAKALVKEKIMTALKAEGSPFVAGTPEGDAALKAASGVIGKLEKAIVRRRIQKEGLRIDGRDTKTVREIKIEPSVLPRAHGSVIFARGETKSMVVSTLGSSTDEQRTDSLTGDSFKKFMLHYNFAPFSVGEVKPVRVSRREIGHGALAEKALRPVLPALDNFPFTLRVVAETMESNGSSSMAAVCGGCLSLMDAGVPISAPVAGVAMGLIREDDDYLILTDILGDEDALGDMDFKIAGTAEGVTAVQMDIKISGIPPEVMGRALTQAKEARLHILNEMAKILPAPRAELSKYAPQMEVVEVNPEIIRLIIGPGGKNIKQITADTGASIDIDDSGKVSIFAPTQEALERAKEMVLYYDQRAELGKDYLAKVKKIMEIGAIVEILPNLEALVHISQLDTGRVAKTEDAAQLGQEMKVKVIEINGDRIRASRKAVMLEEQGHAWDPAETARPPRREGGDRDRGDRGDRGRGDRGDRGGRDRR